MFDNWYDYLNPLEYVDYAFGNGDSVDTATAALDGSKAYWDANKTNNETLLNNYMQSVDSTYNGNNNILNKTYGNALQNYDSAMADYKNMGAYTPGQFNYSKSVEEFMSPAVAMRQKAASDAITKSQANAGNMFSSDYLNALNAKAQAIASEEYDKAYDRMNSDRQMQLNEWQAQNAENRAAYDSQADIYKNLVTLYGNDRSNYTTGLLENNNSYLNNVGDYYSNLINNNNAYTQGMTNIDIAKANAELSHDNGISNMLDFGLNAFNTFAAG